MACATGVQLTLSEWGSPCTGLAKPYHTSDQVECMMVMKVTCWWQRWLMFDQQPIGKQRNKPQSWTCCPNLHSRFGMGQLRLLCEPWFRATTTCWLYVRCTGRWVTTGASWQSRCSMWAWGTPVLLILSLWRLLWRGCAGSSQTLTTNGWWMSWKKASQRYFMSWLYCTIAHYHTGSK